MSRKPGEVTLTAAMARWVYGVIFAGREHLFAEGRPQHALLARFQRAGHGAPPQELEGQIPIAGIVDETHVTERSSHITPDQEAAAAEALALDNAAYAAAHKERIVSAAGGVTGGGGGASQERYADPSTYMDQQDMAQTARDRALHGHGVAAGTQ